MVQALPPAAGTARRTTVTSLFERDEQVAAVDALLSSITDERGGALVFEGVAGSGKTSLLREAAEVARGRGFQVLHAIGHDLEAEFPWGVVMQLFDGVPQGDERFVGAAQLAQPLLDGTALAMGSTDPFPLIHGLYWLVSGLAETAPVLLVVDDAQWSDVESLRLLSYLLPRIGGQQVGVLLAVRPGEQVGEQVTRLLGNLVLEAGVQGLPPLDDASIHAITRARLPEATDRFCEGVAAIVGRQPPAVPGGPVRGRGRAIDPRRRGCRAPPTIAPRRCPPDVAGATWPTRDGCGEGGRGGRRAGPGRTAAPGVGPDRAGA